MSIYSCTIGILVTGLQVTIVILGRGKLDRYVECLEESLLEQFNATVLIPVNSTIPVLNITYLAWMERLKYLHF